MGDGGRLLGSVSGVRLVFMLNRLVLPFLSTSCLRVFHPKHVQANAGKPEFSSFPAFAAANENILMVSQY